MTARASLPARLGRWALVAGASEGLGEAYARALARRGFDLVLVARRTEPLEALATALRSEASIEVRTVALDLGAPDALERLAQTVFPLEIGIAIYNAAFAPNGLTFALEPSALDQVVDVNVRGPLLFARAFTPAMVARGRGALVIVSSLAGMQGTPRLASYAASKAFGRVLAEGLWAELRPHGVHVVGVCAGAIRTPNYLRTSRREAPGIWEPARVAEHTLRSLHRGPILVPGWINRIAELVVGRWLPRRWAIAMIASSTKDLS